MWKKLFKKEFAVEAYLTSYLEKVSLTKDRFKRAWLVYLTEGLSGDFDFFIQETHKAESQADDVRHQILSLMYEKALIPDSRGDILGLLEALDEVPGQLESILFMIRTQSLAVPEFLFADVRELITTSLESYDLLLKQVAGLLELGEDGKSIVAEIDQLESMCDHIERRLITNIFASNLDGFMKLQLKELVIEIGRISDLADLVSRRAYIISCKRNV